VEVISFPAFFSYDECIIVRTVFLSWGGVMNSSLGIIVIGCLLRTVFGVIWLFLLHRLVRMMGNVAENKKNSTVSPRSIYEFI